jgi:hypothetical protein
VKLLRPATYTSSIGHNRVMRILVILLLASTASGQTITLNLISGNRPPALVVEVNNISIETLKLNFGVTLASVAQIRLTLRDSNSFGPFGNLVLEGSASISNNRKYLLDISGQAVFGPVAARARIALGNSAQSQFLPELRFSTRPPTVLGGLDDHWQKLNLGLNYRASRGLLLKISPSIFLTAGNLGGSVRAVAHFHRLFGVNSLELEAEGHIDRSVGNRHFDVGATYVTSQRYSPKWSLGILAGIGNAGLKLGTRLRGTQSLRNGGSIAVTLASEPYRNDFDANRLWATITYPVPESKVSLQAVAGLSRGVSGTATHLAVKMSRYLGR